LGDDAVSFALFDGRPLKIMSDSNINTGKVIVISFEKRLNRKQHNDKG